MAPAPDRVDPVFGDALAGDGGMTDPVSPVTRRDTSFAVFPDALSALPLPALTVVVPASADGSVGAPRPAAAADQAPSPAVARPAATRTSASAFGQPPTGRPWSGYPPPGQPRSVQPPPIAPARAYGRPTAPPRPGRTVSPSSRGGVVAPASGRRPEAGLGYSPPPTTAAGVVRPPAYLPQNQGMAQLRAAVQQVRGARPPGSPPAAPPRPQSRARPAAARRGSRASSVWSLFVFAVILLVSTGLGQKIIDAVSQLLHHR